MGVLEKVGDTLSSVGKDVVNKAKASNNVNKIKQQIIYEEERIEDFYNQLGKNYYKDKIASARELYAKLCEEIENRSSRIDRLKLQINSLKGIKICTCCNSVIANNFLFCGVCGEKLPEELTESNIDEDESYPKNYGSFIYSQGK